MLTFKTPIATAPFTEHPVTDLSRAEAQEFDIVAPVYSVGDILNGTFNLQHYCQSLLGKIVLLNKSKIKPFIRYQCEQLSDPFTWLNKLEKLIDLNREHFTTSGHNIKIEKALVVIELFRQEIESGKFNNSKFNFKKVKQKIQCYKTPEEKMSYLLEVKTEYLQYKPNYIDPAEVPFNVQCELEIDLLKIQRKLNKKKSYPIPVEEGDLKDRVRGKVRGCTKLRINSNVNQFVDIFFRLMNEKYINGKPVLEGSPNELAEIISGSFTDKEGKEISVDTVKTILRPSRIEKRPKGDLRIEI